MTDRKVGDTVYIDMSALGKISGYIGKIIKVTPTGLFDVAHGLATTRFNKHGEVFHRNRWRNPIIVDEARWNEIKGEIKSQELQNQINEHCKRIMDNKSDIGIMREAYIALGAAIEGMEGV